MNNTHQDHCQCSICKSIDAGATEEEAIRQHLGWEASMMAEYGWFAHYVHDDDDSPTGFNVHTHGLEESFQHRDFQIVCPLPKDIAHSLLANIVDRVKEGDRFSDGDVVERICGNGYKVKLVTAQECGREVLRLILPDKAGELERDTIDGKFATQYADLEAV